MTTIYSFTCGTDGGYPAAGLVEATDGALYGTTTLGGANGLGTVFRFSSSGLQTLHSFDPNADGNSPYSALIVANDGNLYGVLAQGAYDAATQDYAGGTIFQVTTAGAYQNLYSLPEDESLGTMASGRLLQASDGNFWGTTSSGGANGYGTAFVWNASSGATDIHDFGETEGSPIYGLVQLGNKIYGTTFPDLTGYGEVFSVDLATRAFAVLYAFTGQEDGGAPASSLLGYSDGSLYGATQSGGANGTGTLFRLNSAGQPVTLYSFPAGSLNTFADAALVEGMDGNLYVPLLFDSDAGLSSTEMDGAGNVMQLQMHGPGGAPVALKAVGGGRGAGLTWSVANAASLTAQECFAFSSPATSWSGVRTASGTADISLPAVGNYTFSLTCGGSESAVVTINSAIATTSTLSAPGSVHEGQTGQIVATVQSAGGANATGTVQIMVSGSILLARLQLANGSAGITASAAGVPPGTYSLQAIYSGDATHAGSTSAIARVVVTPPATTTELAVSSQSIAPGQKDTLTATVSSSAGTPSGIVTFFYQTLMLGTAHLNGGAASLTVSSAGVPAGTYGLHAAYSGSANFSGSSSQDVNVTIR